MNGLDGDVCELAPDLTVQAIFPLPPKAGEFPLLKLTIDSVLARCEATLELTPWSTRMVSGLKDGLVPSLKALGWGRMKREGVIVEFSEVGTPGGPCLLTMTVARTDDGYTFGLTLRDLYGDDELSVSRDGDGESVTRLLQVIAEAERMIPPGGSP